MAESDPIPLGNPMRLRVTFSDENNIPFDPASAIQIIVEDGNEQTTTYNYPADLLKDSVGVYSIIVEASNAGWWNGQGTGKLANGMNVTTPVVWKQVK